MTKPKPTWFVIDHETGRIKPTKGWALLEGINPRNIDTVRLYKGTKWALKGLSDATAYSVYQGEGELVWQRLQRTDAWLSMKAQLRYEAENDT